MEIKLVQSRRSRGASELFLRSFVRYVKALPSLHRKALQIDSLLVKLLPELTLAWRRKKFGGGTPKKFRAYSTWKVSLE
jgi:hypothetical protein